VVDAIHKLSSQSSVETLLNSSEVKLKNLKERNFNFGGRVLSHRITTSMNQQNITALQHTQASWRHRYVTTNKDSKNV